MPYLGENIPKLGFGLMRLPQISQDVIDQKQFDQMTDEFLEAGFTYFDTAYGYAKGESEKAAGKALIERYPRERFQFATKLPAWIGAKTKEDAQQMFFTSLERTGAGYFDYYLLHNIGAKRGDVFEEYDLWNFVFKQKQAGLIHHVGFSFHDNAQMLDEVLTKHPETEFVQLQINWADWLSGTVQSKACHDVAWGKHGKPVIVMEPIKGGMLANPPNKVKAVFDAAEERLSYAAWALRFAASLPGVITVLSGMSDLAQLRENVAFMKDFAPIGQSGMAVIDEARNVLDTMPSVPCTMCKYCMPGCPQKINIPGIFDALNRELVFDNPKSGKFEYGMVTGFFGSPKASACIECGACETVCPQKLQIIDWLKKVAEKYD